MTNFIKNLFPTLKADKPNPLHLTFKHLSQLSDKLYAEDEKLKFLDAILLALDYAQRDDVGNWYVLGGLKVCFKRTSETSEAEEGWHRWTLASEDGEHRLNQGYAGAPFITMAPMGALFYCAKHTMRNSETMKRVTLEEALTLCEAHQANVYVMP